jgi:hypothetical protein
MKWYVLTLFLLVGFVWSASAQQVDPKLVGDWQTTDGPCKPCTLSIQENGRVTFDHSGSAIQVVAAQVNADPGVNVMLPQGGRLDLRLTTGSNMLVGFYTNFTQTRMDQAVAFRRR